MSVREQEREITIQKGERESNEKQQTTTAEWHPDALYVYENHHHHLHHGDTLIHLFTHPMHEAF